MHSGVVGLGKGFMYLMSPVHPADTGLQLGNLPAVLAAGIYSVSSLSFIFLSPLFLSVISSTISSISLLPFSGGQPKITQKG